MCHGFHVYSFWDMIALCSSNWNLSSYIVQVGVEHVAILQYPACWDYKHTNRTQLFFTFNSWILWFILFSEYLFARFLIYVLPFPQVLSVYLYYLEFISLNFYHSLKHFQVLHLCFLIYFLFKYCISLYFSISCAHMSTSACICFTR